MIKWSRSNFWQPCLILRFLVIDEADQVLKENKHNWFTKLNELRKPIIPNSLYNLKKLKVPFQKLLFSATLTDNPTILKSLDLYGAKLITVENSSVKLKSKSENEQSNQEENQENQKILADSYVFPEKLSKKYLIVSTGFDKLLLLKHLLQKHSSSTILIFCNTLQSCERLANLFNLTYLSNQLTEKQKISTIKKFHSKKIKILIATNQLSRGMDLESEIVIEYESSKNIENFIHRVGRTARGGSEGLALSILKKDQVSFFKQMVKKYTKVRSLKYDKQEIEGFREEMEKSLENLKRW